MPTTEAIAGQLIEMTQDGHIDWTPTGYDAESNPTGWRANHGNCQFTLFSNNPDRLDTLPPDRNNWVTLHDPIFITLLNEVAIKFSNQQELDDALTVIFDCLKPDRHS